jgi:CBS domain-containing protein
MAIVRARELAGSYPTVTLDTPAVEGARLLARERLPGLLVVDQQGKPVFVLPATQVLRLGIPGYARDDPALARVVDEAHADVFLRELGNRTISECFGKKAAELPAVNDDDTVLEVAALMAQARSPIVVVLDRKRALVGVITLHKLLDQVLAR